MFLAAGLFKKSALFSRMERRYYSFVRERHYDWRQVELIVCTIPFDRVPAGSSGHFFVVILLLFKICPIMSGSGVGFSS